MNKQDKFYCKVGQATVKVLSIIVIAVTIEAPIIYQIMK